MVLLDYFLNFSDCYNHKSNKQSLNCESTEAETPPCGGGEEVSGSELLSVVTASLKAATRKHNVIVQKEAWEGQKQLSW